jgi:copper(I)-binding protein
MSHRSLALAALLLAAPLAAAPAQPAAAQEYKAGAIEITKPWARASAGGAKVGVVYMTLTSLNWPDELVSATSAVADKVEFHDQTEENGVAKMRAVKEVAVKAGDTVTLAPGGLHLMLMGLKEPLVEGKRIPLTLTFRKGQSVDIKVPVLAVGAGGPDGQVGGAMGGMDHGSMPGMDHGAMPGMEGMDMGKKPATP